MFEVQIDIRWISLQCRRLINLANSNLNTRAKNIEVGTNERTASVQIEI